MLQHNEYSREAWLATRKMLAQFIYQGLEPSDARKQNHKKLDSGHRQWKVTRGAKISGLEGLSWTHTIADVRLKDPEVYCADVKLWAKSVLADTEKLMQALNVEA